MRRALLLILLGLVVQVFSLYELTPGTFLLFAGVSLPLVSAGIFVFARHVWRVLKETRAL
jgi:hypothetical protein